MKMSIVAIAFVASAISHGWPVQASALSSETQQVIDETGLLQVHTDEVFMQISQLKQMVQGMKQKMDRQEEEIQQLKKYATFDEGVPFCENVGGTPSCLSRSDSHFHYHPR